MSAFLYTTKLHDKDSGRDLHLYEICVDKDGAATDGADLTAIGYAHDRAVANRFAASQEMLKALYDAQAEMLPFSMPVPKSVTIAIAKARGQQ